MGKANQNFVQFWCEAEQTGPARVSYLLGKKRRKTPLVSSQRELKFIKHFEKLVIRENQNEIAFAFTKYIDLA